MTDHTQPITVGRLLIYQGHVFPRIRGGEIAQPSGAPAGGAPAQPGSGEGEGLGLYDLNAAPPEIRPFIEEELRKVEANVTRKFQESADFRQQAEPYMGLEGLTDVEPEELQRLLQFHQEVLSDPEAFQAWFNAVGEELGLLGGDGQPAGDYEDPDGSDDGDPLVEAAVERVMAAVDERLAPLEQKSTQQEQETRITTAQQEIRDELDGLKDKHGEFNEDLVCQLSLAYDGAPDAIQRGFADYQRFTGQVETNAFEQKDDTPAPANGGGTPATQVEPITDWSQAKEAAKARFAATR